MHLGQLKVDVVDVSGDSHATAKGRLVSLTFKVAARSEPLRCSWFLQVALKLWTAGIEAFTAVRVLPRQVLVLVTSPALRREPAPVAMLTLRDLLGTMLLSAH